MDYAVYCLVRALVAIIGRLPLEFVFRLGSACGLVAWCILPRYRRLALRNVRIALGGTLDSAGIRRVARGGFQRLGGNLLSAMRLARMTQAEIETRVELLGWDHLRACLEGRKGAVMAINHMGNWELYAELVNYTPGHPVGTIYQSLRNPHINAMIDRDRRRMGLETFDRKKGFTGALDLLGRGGTLAVLTDQHAGDSGVWMPFFGRLASTSPLAATLAQRVGCRVQCVAIHTVGVARWKVRIRPPIEAVEMSVEELTHAINRALEAEIQASPEDWFWVHNRWKTPSPRFLLGRTKRGVWLPQGTGPGELQPFRILVRSSNWLGDAVMSIPAVEAVKEGRPDARVTVLTPAKLAGLWRRVGAVDEVLEIRPGESPRRLARRLRGEPGWEVAILFPNSLRSALEARWLGVPRITGYAGHWRRKLLHDVVREPDATAPPQHQADRYLRLAEFCGARRGRKASFARRATRPAGPQRVGICPGAEYGPAKRWPAERFAGVIAELNREGPEGLEWVIFGVAGDAPLAAEIEGACGVPVRNLAGKTSLEELMDELSACALLLTNDTGTMHLAAFLGVPVVALFGSTEPKLTAPLGDFHRLVRRKAECSPCFLRECPLDFRCLNAITVEEVSRVVREELARDE